MERKNKFTHIYRKSGAQLFNSTINISLRHKYIYFEVPKVASSSLKSTLHSLELGQIDHIKVGPHPEINASPFVKPYQLPEDQLEKLLFSPGYFKFSFVRNPVARALSAYLDKICNNEPQSKQILIRASPNKKLASECSFLDFLEIISEIPDFERDKHWKSISQLIHIDSIDFDFIGKLENLESDVKIIQKKLPIPVQIPRFSPHRTDAEKKIEQYVDNKCMKLIQEIYHDDFVNFGY